MKPSDRDREMGEQTLMDIEAASMKIIPWDEARQRVEGRFAQARAEEQEAILAEVNRRRGNVRDTSASYDGYSAGQFLELDHMEHWIEARGKEST